MRLLLSASSGEVCLQGLELCCLILTPQYFLIKLATIWNQSVEDTFVKFQGDHRDGSQVPQPTLLSGRATPQEGGSQKLQLCHWFIWLGTVKETRYHWVVSSKPAHSFLGAPGEGNPGGATPGGKPIKPDWPMRPA